MSKSWILVLTLLFWVPLSTSFAADPTPIAISIPARSEPVSYINEVAEIFSAKCLACHNETLAESKLNMEDVGLMIKGGKRGSSLIAGKADESLLFQMAAHRVEPVMPPATKKAYPPLTSEELGLVKLWIDAGALDDSLETSETPNARIEIGKLPPGLHAINAVDLTPDGQRIGAGRANVVQVLDTVSGLELIRLGGHRDYIQSLKFSPDGRRLAAGSYQSVSLWNVPRGGQRASYEGHLGSPIAIVRLNNGDRFATTGLDRSIKIWDTTSPKPIKTYATPGDLNPVALAGSLDSQTLAIAYSDGSIKIIRVEDGSERISLKGESSVIIGLVFIGDQKVASAAKEGNLLLWDLTNPAAPISLSHNPSEITGIAASADGGLLATSGLDGVIRVWDTFSKKLRFTISLEGGAVKSIAFNSNGKRLLAGSADGTARLFDVEAASIVQVFKTDAGPIESLAFNPNDSRIATGVGAGLKIWETETGRGVTAFGHPPKSPSEAASAQLTCLAFLKDELVVSGALDHTLRSWFFEGRWAEEHWLGPHAFRVLAIDFNPDGTLLAAGGGEPSRSGEIRLWEVGKGMPVRTLDSLHSDTVFSLKFSPDGSKLASAGADKFVKVTKVDSGKEYRSYEGHTQHVMAVDWKADGKQLVSGGADSVLKLWDVETGEQIKTLAGAGKQVTSVRWIPSKNEIAGASGDQLVRLWNAENGQALRNFGGSTDYLFSVATTTDEKRILAGGADGQLYLWDTETAKLLRTYPNSQP